MPYCSNCSATVSIKTKSCPKCNANFGPGCTWEIIDDLPLEDAQAPTSIKFFAWCGAAIGALIIMVLGSGYGIVTYQFFSSAYSNSNSGSSGQMLLSFLMGVPFCIGVLVAFIASRRKKRYGFAGAATLSVASIALFIFGAGALLREGVICIVMAAPLFFGIAIVGAIFGYAISKMRGAQGPRILSVVVVLPLFFGSIEEHATPPSSLQKITSSITISAPAEAIWKILLSPAHIKTSELRGSVLYFIGMPHPIEAHTNNGAVGATRASRWEKGVHFDEVITHWTPNESISWTYKFYPDSFPPGSLDDHIVIGGRYFDLLSTNYTLEPVTGGTKLTITIESKVKTTFNWYALPWAKFFVLDTANALLRFYKSRAEQLANNSLTKSH